MSRTLRFTPNLESLDQRLNPSSSPQPVLMVLADQRDFHSAAETRVEAPASGGVNVQMGDGSVRFLTDTINVNPAETQAGAVVFVGGWGSSMYQFA